MKYYEVFSGTITMPPRTACGFALYQYSAFLDITHGYPVSLYHRDYRTMRYSDVDYMVKVGDDGTNCFTNECRNYWYLTYGRMYWLLVNWD